MLEAAATAMHLVESGEIPARGPMAHVFQAQEYQPVPPDDPPRRAPSKTDDPWKCFFDELEIAIGHARTDPIAARALLLSVTGLCVTRTCFDNLRDDMIANGVPESFLPTFAEVRGDQALIYNGAARSSGYRSSSRSRPRSDPVP